MAVTATTVSGCWSNSSRTLRISLAPDEGDSWKQEGLYPLFYGAGERPADGFGCLTAWGFGAQRVLDA